MEFKTLGHEAEVQGWKIIVTDGVAELISTDSCALDSVEEPWSSMYTLDELRELAALFVGAVKLLEAAQQAVPTDQHWVLGLPLSDDELDALPTGARVRDRDESSTSDDMRVWIRAANGWRLQKWGTDATVATSEAISRYGAPVLLSLA